MKRIIVLAFAVITAAIALPAPASAQSVPTPADCERQGAKIYYQFLYNDGLMDIGCADKNEVAGAVAPELHVSCSDKFNLGDKPKGTPGSGEKSNLGTTADGSERLVVDYLIMKDLNKDKPKTCGSAVLVPAGGFPGLMVVMAGAAGALAVGTVWNRRRRTAPLPV